MKPYEMLILTPPTVEAFEEGKAKAKELLAEFQAVVESEEDMGVKRLAYEIAKHVEGHYYLFTFQMPGQNVAPLTREMRIHAENVLRFMIVNLEDKLRKDKRKAKKTRRAPKREERDEREDAPVAEAQEQ